MKFPISRKIVLDNGLRVITVPMKGTNAVSVLFLFNTGSDYETKDINGISHFLEHLFFKGTNRRPTAKAVSKELDKFGADFNAFTEREFTGYFVTIDAEQVDVAFDVIADMLLNSKFLDEEIEKERDVVKEEIKMVRDNPSAYISQELLPDFLYGDQPAGWSVAGPEENIDRITREELMSYRKRHYHARNSVLVVAGGITRQEIESKAQTFLGSVPEQEIQPKPRVVEKQRKPRNRIIFRDTDQTQVMLGFRAYNVFDGRNKYAERALSVIMGGNMSSRLFTEVREQRGLAYMIRTLTSFRTDRGSFVIKAGLNNGKVEEAIKIILNELRNVTAHGVTEEEVKDAKTFITGSAKLDLEESFEIAENFAVQELLEKKMDPIEETFKQIDRITRDDVVRVACEIFVPERLNLVILGPHRSREFKRNIKSILEAF